MAMELDTPPRNRSINDISEGDAYRLTWFRKDQLQLLMVNTSTFCECHSVQICSLDVNMNNI